MDEKELKRRVFDKMLEINTEQIEKLTQEFAEQVREVNEMDYAELEQMDRELSVDYSRCHTKKS